MSKLKVSFGDPLHGWIAVNIQSGVRCVKIDASDICPSFVLLIDALHLLRSYQGETTVTWACEPAEYDLCFNRMGEIITLSVFVYPDSSRADSGQASVLTVSGSYDEICLPFWRVLQNLQARFTPEELEERWTDPFPHDKLDNLTVLLGKHEAIRK